MTILLMKQMIGLIGAPRSGKDYIATLIKFFIKNASTVAFADVVKEKYFDSVGITFQDFEEIKQKSQDKTEAIRKGLWAYSDAVKKIHGHDYFTNVTMKDAVELGQDLVVFTDVRIPVEMEKMRNLSATRGINLKFMFVHSGEIDFEGANLIGS